MVIRDEEWHVTVAIEKLDAMAEACRVFKQHTPDYLIQIERNVDGSIDIDNSHHPMDMVIGQLYSIKQGLFAHYGRGMYKQGVQMVKEVTDGTRDEATDDR